MKLIRRMGRRIGNIAGFAVLALACQLAQANGTGQITKMAVGRNGYEVFVKLDTPVDQVGCRTRVDYDYYLDLRNAGAKEIFSALLMAKASGQTILVQSTGACDAPGNGLEVIAYTVVQ